jgi:hypothetical protein
LAWTLIPKEKKAPFIRYISKEKKEEDEFNFILPLIRQHLQLSDHDYNANKSRIIDIIKSDMSRWFKYYGIPKKYWMQYSLNYDAKIHEEIKQEDRQKGIWGFA